MALSADRWSRWDPPVVCMWPTDFIEFEVVDEIALRSHTSVMQLWRACEWDVPRCAETTWLLRLLPLSAQRYTVPSGACVGPRVRRSGGVAQFGLAGANYAGKNPVLAQFDRLPPAAVGASSPASAEQAAAISFKATPAARTRRSVAS
jgi:hypothetical protein